jgi:hypothetical protein
LWRATGKKIESASMLVRPSEDDKLGTDGTFPNCSANGNW